MEIYILLNFETFLLDTILSDNVDYNTVTSVYITFSSGNEMVATMHQPNHPHVSKPTNILAM
ncbi:hypothetical protein CBL_11849 [Carabus blaptoides fortunei]